MNLREWTTNNPAVRGALPASDCVNTRHVKVLGILWDTSEDVISMPSCSKLTQPGARVTKRTVLHAICAVYDPLGLLSPILLHGRLFLQQLWSLQLNWDDPLPPDVLNEWHDIVQHMDGLSSLTIPRYYQSSGGEAQLHIFTDASKDAYSAAAYLRISTASSVNTVLIFSKMRLRPSSLNKGKCAKKKELTIPRLELLGVLIGSRMATFLQQQLQMTLSAQVLWTDAKCVLHWLKSTKDLSIFVSNRIHEIRDTPNLQCRYVPTVDNPADLATRPQTTPQLAENDLWWHGPTWLPLDPSKWPIRQELHLTSEVLQQVTAEVRGPATLHSASLLIPSRTSQAGTQISSQIIDCSRFSSLTQVLRVTATVFKAVRALVWDRLPESYRKIITSSHPSFGRNMASFVPATLPCASNIRLAMLTWIKILQQQHYGNVIATRATDLSVPITRQLGLCLDDDDIIRCAGRFREDSVARNVPIIHPILLPRRERFTDFLISQTHRQLQHAGVSHTLAIIRQRYWIPQGRAAAHAVLNKCVVCRKAEGPPFPLPKMPPLPDVRIRQSRPFQHIGLDYFGPLFVTTATESDLKVWVCLFTCTATRAVHLGVVLSLSSQEFLMAFRRFAARRGTPSTVILDNASQHFPVQAAISAMPLEANITFKYITEYAHWQGGLYERLVGLAKRSLRIAIGRRKMNLSQLMTVITESEAVLNSRPLTYLGSDIDSNSRILTPAHFLSTATNFGLSMLSLPEEEWTPPSDKSIAPKLLNTWRNDQAVLDKMWQVWQEDYLPTLRERLSLFHRQSNRKIWKSPTQGEVVIVKDEAVKRGFWKLGIVEELHKSADGEVRSATVRMPNRKLLRRSVGHLYPIEVPPPTADNSPDDVLDTATTNNRRPSSPRPKRKAALEATKRIDGWLS